jgi:hypothetical protein
MQEHGFWSEEKHGYSKKGEIILRWTCCDACHAEHKSLSAARVHYLFLTIKGAIWKIRNF